MRPEDFARRATGDEGKWLWTPRPDEIYLPGGIPVVGANFGQRGEIAVPRTAARAPQPIDLIATYITAEEGRGERLGIEPVISALAKTGLEPVLLDAARLLGLLEKLDANRLETELAAVAAELQQPHRGRVTGLLNGGKVLFAPQAVLMLMKLALFYSSTDPAVATSVHLVTTLMAIQDDLGLLRTPGQPSPTDRGPLLREVVQSQVFADHTAEHALMARQQLLWRDSPAELAEDPNAEDLVALFAEATGVTLDDFNAIGTALWVAATQNHRYPIAAGDLGLKLADEIIEAVLRLISTGADELRRLIAVDDAKYNVQWAFDAFRRFPVLRLSGGQLLVLSPKLLLERVFLLPDWDLDAGLRAKKRKKPADRARNYLMKLREHDALQTLRNLMPAVLGVRRFFGEDEIQAAYPHGQNADAALDYGDAWVVAEVSGRPFTRKSAMGGSAEDLENDLQLGIDEKVRQIEATIENLKQDEAALTGYPAVARRRYLPLLIASEGFPVNPLTSDAIEQRMRDKGLLRGDRIGPLHVCDQEELYLIEGLSEGRVGGSLLEMLEQKEQGTFRRAGLKDWLILERGLRPNPPKRLEGPYERSWRAVIEAVGGPGAADVEDKA